MTFKGKVVNVGFNPLYDASTVTLELESGHSLEIVVTNPLAIQLGHELYKTVEVELKDPSVSWPPQSETRDISYPSLPRIFRDS